MEILPMILTVYIIGVFVTFIFLLVANVDKNPEPMFIMSVIIFWFIYLIAWIIKLFIFTIKYIKEEIKQ